MTDGEANGEDELLEAGDRNLQGAWRALISTAEDSVMAELLDTRSFMQSAAEPVGCARGLEPQGLPAGKRLGSASG